MVTEYKIGGISVAFPYKAYGPQLAYMSKVVATLEQTRLRAEGRCNALLESPTGSGKSLALLCSALAWQRNYRAILAKTAAESERSDAPKSDDVFADGGGFVVEDSCPGPKPEGGVTSGVQQNVSGRQPGQIERARKPPKIYYATRTHAQITQVIREFRKTSYQVPMAVLGAKKHYCINKSVLKKKNVDEDCLALLRGSEQGSCRYFKNAAKVKNHPSVRPGGSNEIHDIEDLVTVGNGVKGCPYFASRELATEADIVFCPYSYIVDPIIREAVEADLRGSIIIFDEAHNIEDVAREAGSVDLETKTLIDLQFELQELRGTEPTAECYQPLLEMVQELLGWIDYQSNNLTRLEFEHHSSCWTGAKAVEELRAAGIPIQSFEILLSFSRKAVAAASDENVNHLSGHSAKALERLFRVLQFMLQNNARRAVDYQLVVQKFRKRDAAFDSAWVVSASLWSLNPAVAFEEIALACRSIIVTSGTLAPIESFASELGVPFEVCIETPHVVDMGKQVWATALSVGPKEVVMNASYKNAENFQFQDAVGAALLEILKVTPDGVLVFLPSYKLLKKLCDRWQSTGLWLVLASRKRMFIEPRANDENFEAVLRGYYAAVNGEQPKTIPTSRKTNRKLKVMGPPSASHTATNGAVFLAVCRGKVSEGIDFSDKNARAVLQVVVGIPFPNVKDIQVTLKKQYNSTHRTTKNLLGGDQWYCQQAFRALNQAVGRCIRHRFDYGGIILLDERFKASKNLEYMSKWLRNYIRLSENFQASMQSLKVFFENSKELDELQSARSNVVDSVPEVAPPVQVKDSSLATLPPTTLAKGLSPVTLPPITPHKFESGSLRVSDCLNMCTVAPDRISNCEMNLTGSEATFIRSKLSPQFDATKANLHPQFEATEGGSSLHFDTRPSSDFCDDELERCCQAESGPDFLTQLCFNRPLSLDESPQPNFPNNHNSTQNSPAFVVEKPPGACAADVCNDDLDFEKHTISIVDDEGAVFTRKQVMNCDQLYQTPGPRTASGRFRCTAVENGLPNSKIAESQPVQQKPLGSTTLRFHEEKVTDRDTEAHGATGPVIPGNGLKSSPFPAMHCRKCGLGVGTMSGGSKTETITKSYLTFLLHSSGLKSPSGGVSNEVYSTDISCLGPGVTECSYQGRENGKDQGAGVWIERDGCVFRALACSHCTDSCIGAHILAANRKNLDCIDKVVLFVDSVSLEQKDTIPDCLDNSKCLKESPLSTKALNLKAVDSSLSKRSLTTPPSTGKLKLRRREK